jgi:hypothetical protein
VEIRENPRKPICGNLKQSACSRPISAQNASAIALGLRAGAGGNASAGWRARLSWPAIAEALGKPHIPRRTSFK